MAGEENVGRQLAVGGHFFSRLPTADCRLTLIFLTFTPVTLPPHERIPVLLFHREQYGHD